MDINSIKARVSSLSQARIPGDPAQFAEGLNEMNSLHQHVANYVAEDGKRSWEGTKLHEQITRVENTWRQAAAQPVQQNRKLTEGYTKSLKLTKAVAEAAVNYKRKLAEANRKLAEQAKLIEELVARGQAWVALADKRKAQNEELEFKHDVACDTAAMLTNRYNEDVVALGSHVLVLEFKDKAQTPEIQKALKEAKHPNHVLAIREQLEGKPAGTPAPAAPATPVTPAPVTEAAKSQPVTPATPAPATPAPVTQTQLLVPSVRSISESVAMTRRLSKHTAPV